MDLSAPMNSLMNGLDAIALYGSVARGDSTPTSDIDLLVVFSDGTELAEKDSFVTELRDSVQLWTGNDAQIYALTSSSVNTLQENRDPMVESWNADGLVVFGDQILTMRKAP